MLNLLVIIIRLVIIKIRYFLLYLAHAFINTILEIEYPDLICFFGGFQVEETVTKGLVMRSVKVLADELNQFVPVLAVGRNLK